MNVENIRHHIEERNMEALLTALEKGNVNLASDIKDISQETIDEACKLKLAYRVSDTILVSKKYAYNCLLNLIKKKQTTPLELEIGGATISPSFINNLLEALVEDDLVFKNGQIYCPNYAKIISQEKVEIFLRSTISVVSVKDVVEHFGLNPFVKNQFGDDEYSEASQHCKKLLNFLVVEKKVSAYHSGIDKYYWNQ